MKLTVKSTRDELTRGQLSRRPGSGSKPPLVLLTRKTPASVRWLYKAVMRLRRSGFLKSDAGLDA